MQDFDSYQEKMKLKHPKIFENASKVSNLFGESDRGATLIAAAILEYQLEEILFSFFRDIKSAKELLNGFNAPLGTFSSKIKISHALGLIEDDEYNQIEIFRKIRNQFAHEFNSLSFESKGVKERIINLSKPIDKTYSMRECFDSWFLTLNSSLLFRAEIIRKEKRKTRIFPNKPIRCNIVELKDKPIKK